MKFTKIPADTFQKLQINAGILTTDFTPATGTIGEAGQIGATTGGISYSATPTYKDYGEDIDNCPKNTKELIEVDSWEAKASGTFAIADTAIAKEPLRGGGYRYGRCHQDHTEKLSQGFRL